jgi:hypothetical protein
MRGLAFACYFAPLSQLQSSVIGSTSVGFDPIFDNHTNGAVDADPTVQTCWDTDRLDLSRLEIKRATGYQPPWADTHIESAYSWSRQPKGLLGDELGYELSPLGQNKQAREHTQGNA